MSDRGIFLIGIFKLVKAGLLLLVAFGALSILDNGVREVFEKKIMVLASDPHYRYLSKAASFLGIASKKEVEFFLFGSLFYAAIFATEGIGLLMQKRWAEYFSAIVTATFIPLEVYEMFRHPNGFKGALIAINVAVLVYLVWRIYR